MNMIESSTILNRRLEEADGKDILAKQERSFVTKAKKSRTKKRAK